MNLVHKLNHPQFLEYMSLTSIYEEAILTRVNAGPFFPTKAEKAWLSHFLKNEESSNFLSQETKCSLEKLLHNDNEKLDLKDVLVEKGKPAVLDAPSEFIKLLRTLISVQAGMVIIYSTKNGDSFEEKGIPYKLMYNIAKKAWYIWWLRIDRLTGDTSRRLTPLTKIENVTSCCIDRNAYEKELLRLLPQYEDKKTVTLLWQPQFQNMDIHRVLHAFSSFEKEVNEVDGVYRLAVHYYPEEEKYLLSKIRLFGPHLRIEDSLHLQHELLATAQQALEKYLAYTVKE